MTEEKWLLSVPTSVHFGYIRQSFKRGAVIVKSGSSLEINGSTFNDTRDLEVLKKLTKENPEHPYIIAYSRENEYILSGVAPELAQAAPQKPSPSRRDLPVEQHDSFDREDIDISHTKAQKTEEPEKTDDLPIIRGDISAEERLKELANSQNPDDIVARTEILASTRWTPDIVSSDEDEALDVHARNEKTATELKAAAAEISSKRSDPSKNIDFALHGQVPSGQELDGDLFDEVTPSGVPAKKAEATPAVASMPVSVPDTRIDDLSAKVDSLATIVDGFRSASISPDEANNIVEGMNDLRSIVDTLIERLIPKAEQPEGE